MKPDGNLLGIDVGSSSIKVVLLNGESGAVTASATSPKTELAIDAPKPGWAEQDPALWWEHIVAAAAEVKAIAGRAWEAVSAVGITYQMHGLVIIDKAGAVLRPSIIWCDSRAVEIGEKAFRGIGEKTCLSRLLNSPGNFTASKLAWVKENEPRIFSRIHKFLLPGDWVAFRMTGEACTSPSGLSEGILWDFTSGGRADIVLDWYKIPADVVPETRPTFSVQGHLTAEAAAELGLKKGVPVSYRAGDQPNNAFSLRVLDPGEAATTAGTSGVVYGVAGTPAYDPLSRVNTFVHVSHEEGRPRFGVLLCVNGTGILNRWVRKLLVGDSGAVSYDQMNAVASQAPVGADGLVILPFGNGAERTLENRTVGGSFLNIDFNRHGIPHLLRAAQEGIVYSLNYGVKIMKGVGIDARTVRAGYANMFLSPLFREAFATVTGARVELFSTDGAQGAARGAGVGAGMYRDLKEAFVGLAAVKTVEPDVSNAAAYQEAYGTWEQALQKSLS
ncbi:MAG TPA: FGGY family carbohydrate kinase [Spirochaetia bacterium]|nr:FGGY family carbohydrate kinase [Spirochaetia bacterium]